MTTFARIVGGFAIDCRVQASATELAACFHPDWLAKNPFVQVPDGTLHGAKDNGNGTFTNHVPVVFVTQPINAGNPFFGKPPLPTDKFYGIMGQVLSPLRYKRLRNDAGFLWVQDVLDHTSIVDVDDKSGAFLKIQTYLTTTNGEDGNLLMEKVERDAIMQAWK